MNFYDHFAARAQDDADDQAEYYLLNSGEKLFIEFITALGEGVKFILKNPDCGPRVKTNFPHLPGLRVWSVPGFEIIRMYYLPVRKGGLRVIRVLHGARDVTRILSEEPIPEE